MYCPNCGKEIPDKSQFCLHCGKSTTMVSGSEKPSVPTEWEYSCFFLEWEKGEGGKYPLGVGRNEQLAQVFFWNNAQIHILPALQKELDKGWQAVSEVGPAGFHLLSRGGNPGWLEVRVFRVKLRRPRTTPLKSYETAILGKWQHIETTGGGLMTKIVSGLITALGAQITQMEFFKENQYAAYTAKASLEGYSGVYTFTDEHHIRMYSDPPKVFSAMAELNKTYDELIINNAQVKQQLRFRKLR